MATKQDLSQSIVPLGPTLIAKIYLQPTTTFPEGKGTISQVPLFWRTHSSTIIVCFQPRWAKASLIVLGIDREEIEERQVKRDGDNRW